MLAWRPLSIPLYDVPPAARPYFERYKMDPKRHPLITVVKLIDAIRPADAGTYCLYAEHHELHICRTNLVPKDSPVVYQISTLDINTGLSTFQWNRIDARIRIFIKEGILEWNPQKP